MTASAVRLRQRADAVASGAVGVRGRVRSVRWGRALAAVGAAALAGLALLGSLEWSGGWWLAPVGVALSGVVSARHGVGRGGALAAVTGLAVFVPLLSWANLYTGDVPWLLLAGSQAAFVAVGGAAVAFCAPLVMRWGWLWPPVIGALWTAQEALRSRVPFGGFPWGRLAFGQGDSPLLRFAAIGGAPLVTFVVAAAGGLLAGLGYAVVGAVRSGSLRSLLPAGAGVAAAVLVVLAGVWPLAPVAAAGPVMRVAIVQGNVPRLGLDFNEQRRRVLDNHVEGTLALARRVAAGEVGRPDLVVWPENSSDIDPLRNADARARIDEAASAIGAPILVGAGLNAGVADRAFNAGLLWQPGVGPVQRYVKRHPVPFAEYMPMRAVARLVSDKVDLLRVEFVAGRDPGVLTVGGARVGDVICFEVAYDGLVRDVVAGGGQLIVVQTNNATFNPAEARQQLAMVRLRAVEHGRPALMASTVGISAFVGADGHIRQRTAFDTAAVLVDDVRLSGETTLATAVGAVPEYLLVTVAVGCLAGAAALRRRGRGGLGARR